MKTSKKTKLALAILLMCLLPGFLPGIQAQDFDPDSINVLIEEGKLSIGESWQMGHKATGKLDTVKAEIVIAVSEVELTETTKYKYPIKTLVVIEGYIEREKYSYYGDRMPNQLPNNGGIYDDYYITKRYLDKDKNEIKEYVWMARELGKNSG